MARQGKLVDDMFGPSIEGPADDIVDSAWEAKTPAASVKLARKALSIDLDAIDAYNILGLHAETLAERIALFREGALIGERLFAPFTGDEEMAWWGFVGTRPWMRAQHNLGLALTQAEAFDEAIVVFDKLLMLNPDDNQGIRYILLNLFAQGGEYDRCKELFQRYPDDGSVEFPATRLVVALSGTKVAKSSAKLLKPLKESNPFVLDMLKAAAAGKWPSAPKGEYIVFGGRDQAASYLDAANAPGCGTPGFSSISWSLYRTIARNVVAASRSARFGRNVFASW